MDLGTRDFWAASSSAYEVRNSRINDRSFPDLLIKESRNRFKSSLTWTESGVWWGWKNCLWLYMVFPNNYRLFSFKTTWPESSDRASGLPTLQLIPSDSVTPKPQVLGTCCQPCWKQDQHRPTGEQRDSGWWGEELPNNHRLGAFDFFLWTSSYVCSSVFSPDSLMVIQNSWTPSYALFLAGTVWQDDHCFNRGSINIISTTGFFLKNGNYIPGMMFYNSPAMGFGHGHAAVLGTINSRP